MAFKQDINDFKLHINEINNGYREQEQLVEKILKQLDKTLNTLSEQTIGLNDQLEEFNRNITNINNNIANANAQNGGNNSSNTQTGNNNSSGTASNNNNAGGGIPPSKPIPNINPDDIPVSKVGIFMDKLDLLGKKIKAVWEVVAAPGREAVNQMGSLERAMRPLNAQMLLNSKQIHNYQIGMGVVAEETKANYGKGFEEIAKIHSSIMAQTNRTTMLTAAETKSLAAHAAVLGDTEISTLVADFDVVKMSLTDSLSYLNNIKKTAQTTGVDFKNLTGQVSKNIQIAQSYNFKNGLNSLTNMAAQSLRMRYNFEETLKIAKTYSTVATSIEAGAKTQLLGGAFGRFADPLQNMYLSLNDIEGFDKRVNSLAMDVMKFDRNSGMVRFKSAIDQKRAEAFAEAQGMDLTDLQKRWSSQITTKLADRETNAAIQGKERERVNAQANYSKEQNAFVVKVWDDKSRQFSEKKVSELTKKDVGNMRGDETEDMSVIAKSTQATAEIAKNILESMYMSMGVELADSSVGKVAREEVLKQLQNINEKSSQQKALYGVLITGIPALIGLVTSFIGFYTVKKNATLLKKYLQNNTPPSTPTPTTKGGKNNNPTSPNFNRTVNRLNNAATNLNRAANRLNNAATNLNRSNNPSNLSNKGANVLNNAATNLNRAANRLNNAATNLNRNGNKPIGKHGKATPANFNSAINGLNRAATNLNRAGNGLNRAATNLNRGINQLNNAAANLNRAANRSNKPTNLSNRSANVFNNAATNLNRAANRLNNAAINLNRAANRLNMGNTNPGNLPGGSAGNLPGGRLPNRRNRLPKKPMSKGKIGVIATVGATVGALAGGGIGYLIGKNNEDKERESNNINSRVTNIHTQVANIYTAKLISSEQKSSNSDTNGVSSIDYNLLSSRFTDTYRNMDSFAIPSSPPPAPSVASPSIPSPPPQNNNIRSNYNDGENDGENDMNGALKAMEYASWTSMATSMLPAKALMKMGGKTALKSVPIVGTILGTAYDAIEGYNNKDNYTDVNQKNRGVAVAAASILAGQSKGIDSKDTTTSEKAWEIGGQALSGALAGAAIGSVVPVIGTAVGAAIGGVIGGASAAIGTERIAKFFGGKEEGRASVDTMKTAVDVRNKELSAIKQVNKALNNTAKESENAQESLTNLNSSLSEENTKEIKKKNNSTHNKPIKVTPTYLKLNTPQTTIKSPGYTTLTPRPQTNDQKYSINDGVVKSSHGATIKSGGVTVTTNPNDIIAAFKGSNIISQKMNNNFTNSIKIEPIELKLSGNLSLSSEGKSIDMTSLLKDRTFVTNLTNTITYEINRLMYNSKGYNKQVGVNIQRNTF